jgi:hypothetical protein
MESPASKVQRSLSVLGTEEVAMPVRLGLPRNCGQLSAAWSREALRRIRLRG